MSANRAVRVVATGARLVTGAVVAVACVVGVVAAIHAPWPQVSQEPAQVDVTPLAGDSSLVCNGDLRAIGRDSSDPLAMRSAGATDLTDESTTSTLTRSPIRVVDVADAGDAVVLTGAVSERTAPLIAATESIAVASDDLTGFAAIPCGTPRLESWLVGGSVATGTSDIIVLTNASEVPATVTLSVFGESRSTRTVIVPAASQVSLALTSVAAGSTAPVVQVTSDGAPVRAVLQSSLVRTLDPAGVDLQDAVAGPQQNPVIAGVQAFDGDGDDADMTVLRLLSPQTATQASVVVRAAGSSAAANEFTVDLTAGLPADVSLSGLTPGSYTLEIDADAPVLSAVRQQDGLGRGTDFAWVTPAPEIDADALFAVPAGPTAVLHLMNTTDDDVTVTLSAEDGSSPTEVTVASNRSLDVPVEPTSSYLLKTSGTVHAAVTMAAGGALAGWPVQPSPGAAQSITVYP
jgi:hypothetical protein